MRKKIFKNFKLDIKNYSAGFTLIELLIYMGLFSALLVVTLQMFSSVFDVQTESEAVSSVDSDGKFVMQRFTYDMNRATSISTPASLGSSSATLTIVVNGQNLTYGMDGDNLVLQNETTGTSDQLNSSDTTVSNLSFLKLDGAGKDVVQISFTLNSVAIKRGGKEVKNYQTSAGLR